MRSYYVSSKLCSTGEIEIVSEAILEAATLRVEAIQAALLPVHMGVTPLEVIPEMVFLKAILKSVTDTADPGMVVTEVVEV